MKIESVDMFYLAMPEVLDIGDGSQDMVLVRVRAGDWTGWGECEASPLPTIASLVTPMSHSACHPVLDSVLGQRLDSVADITRIADEVRARSLDLLQTDHALSGIEIALWDLLGKTRKLPVYELLGGAKRRRLKAYASLLRIGETDLIRAECEKALNLGYRQVKIHERTVEAGEAARSVIGPDMPLMMDTNCTWSVTEAEDMIHKLRHLDLTWLEEPIYPPDDYLALKMLRGSGISIAAGENIGNVVHLRHAVALGALDIVQPSAAKMGGISALLEAARICRSGGVEFHPHSPIYGLGLMATLHVLASEEEDLSCEFFFTDLADCPIGPLHKPVDGHFEVPEGDGLGIEVDEDMLDHYAFARR